MKKCKNCKEQFEPVKFLQKYSQKSIHVFGGFGLLSFLFSFISALVMFYYKFFGDKSFIQTPLPILVVFFFLTGIILVMMGLIAEMQNRTYYESQGKKVYLVKETKGFENFLFSVYN